MCSLRALYATDLMKNAIHSSSSATKAAKVIQEYFPEVVLNLDGTVEGGLFVCCFFVSIFNSLVLLHISAAPSCLKLFSISKYSPERVEIFGLI